jgi:hypothetical protein
MVVSAELGWLIPPPQPKTVSCMNKENIVNAYKIPSNPLFKIAGFDGVRECHSIDELFLLLRRYYTSRSVSVLALNKCTDRYKTIPVDVGSYGETRFRHSHTGEAIYFGELFIKMRISQGSGFSLDHKQSLY